MTLGVDRTFPEKLSQMEQTGGRWRTRIPEFVRSGRAHSRPQAPGNRERTQSTPSHGVKDLDKERNANKKTVTMAPVSRCMTSKGQYIARRPLVSVERHTSILKNPLSHELTVQGKQQTGSTGETLLHNDRESQFQRSYKDSLTCPSPSKPSGLSPSASREDLTSPLTTADLRTWSTYEEPALRSASQSKNHSRRSLSSPPLDVYSLTVPLSPKFTSTQQSNHVPSSHLSRKTKADGLLRDSVLRTSSSKVSPPPFHQMSPYQANYWTCAIPTSLPPSPDRRSPNWDPDKEYEALLDYTYPLRPGHTTKYDFVDLGSQLKTDVILEDSGIELDRFCSSSTLSCLDQSVCVTRRGKGGNPHAVRKALGQHGLSSRELSQSKSSDGRLSSSLYSVDHIGLSVESLDGDGKQQGQQSFHYRKLGVFSTSRSPTTFIPTLRVFPRTGLIGDWDEEFLALPGQLQEIQMLSQHLKDISAQISQPVTSSWESLERETSSTEKQSAETTAVQEVEAEMVEEEEEGEGSVSGGPPRTEEPLEDVNMFESRLHMLSTEVNRGSVKEVASIMDRLGGMSLLKNPQVDQGEAEAKESLMQHIQTFCTNLEELIQWLYKVVQKMEVLTPPSVDIESVKTSLADYKSFQRDVHAHRPLTGTVLHTGELLLRCMNSTSPVLKETLMLIERQSRALETHAEHLFSSILSAMDSLTEASSREGTECSE